jgi:hypothetical protein
LSPGYSPADLLVADAPRAERDLVRVAGEGFNGIAFLGDDRESIEKNGGFRAVVTAPSVDALNVIR